MRRDHPLRMIRADRERGAGSAGAEFRGALFAARPAVDSAGEAAAGDAAAGLLLDPLGAPADGAAGVRPVVPLVRRARRRRSGVGPSTFSKNRDRLLDGDIAAKFLAPFGHRGVRSATTSWHSTARSRPRSSGRPQWVAPNRHQKALPKKKKKKKKKKKAESDREDIALCKNAPRAARRPIISVEPCAAAICKGPSPCIVRRFTSAPKSSSKVE